MQETAFTPSLTSASDYRDQDSFKVEAQGHAFTFYPRGSDRFKALLDQIHSARRCLKIFYYMFDADDAGTRVRDALVSAVQRGVDVHLIVDSFGSDASRKFFRPLIEAGGHYAKFSPQWNVRYLIRNHQKFVIADGARVMTGGANISDHYFKSPDENGWCDLSVAIEGPIIQRFDDWFELLEGWVGSEGSQLRRIRQMAKDWEEGEGSVRLLVSAPLVRKDHWIWRFKRDLAHARRLDLVTAYFSPTRSIQKLLADIARRGELRMIGAGKSDIRATIDIARLLYKNLLRAGAQIFEFLPSKLHMKLMVVDDISYFGSANLDKRSIRINVELMVRVEDKALAARLRELMDHMQQSSMQVTPEWYARKSTFWTRLRWRLTYWIGLADYRVAAGLNF